MAAKQAAESHEDEWGLTWYLQLGIYTSILTWTHSQHSLAAAEALGLKIPSDGSFLYTRFCACKTVLGACLWT